MQRWQAVAILGGLWLALGGAAVARETGSGWRLGPQQQSYDDPVAGQARDILDNRFEGRRPAREEQRYDQPQWVGPNGEVMDEAARKLWEKEQRIRSFRGQSEEGYDSDPAPAEEGETQLEEQGRTQPGDSNDPAWQQERQRRQPLPPQMRPKE